MLLKFSSNIVHKLSMHFHVLAASSCINCVKAKQIINLFLVFISLKVKVYSINIFKDNNKYKT